MPQEPNIALQVNSPNFATRLTRLNQEERDENLTQARLKNEKLESDLRELQLEEAKVRMTALGEDQVKRMLSFMGMDVLAQGDLLSRGVRTQDEELVNQAKAMTVNIRDRMEQLGLPTNMIDQFSQVLSADPATASRMHDQFIVPNVRQFLPDIAQEVTDEEGNKIFVNLQTGRQERGEIIPESQISESGQVVRESPSGQLTAEQVSGFEPEQDLDVVTMFRANEQPKSLHRNKQGDFFTLTNEPFQVLDSDRIVEGTNLTGSQADVMGDAESRALNDQQVAAVRFIDISRQLLGVLQNSPDSNTFIANVARVKNDIDQNVSALARQLGSENLLEPSQYAAEFDELGLRNAEMQGLVVSAAFQAAAADAGQQGRSVTDRDVSRFLRVIGANNDDPRAFAQNIMNTAERIDRGFRASYKVRRNEDFTESLGLESLPGFQAASPIDLNDEELMQEIMRQLQEQLGARGTTQTSQ